MVVYHPGEALYLVGQIGPLTVYSKNIPQSVFVGEGGRAPLYLLERLAAHNPSTVESHEPDFAVINKALRESNTQYKATVISREYVFHEGKQIEPALVNSFMAGVVIVLKEKLLYSYIVDVLDRQNVIVALDSRPNFKRQP